jgi:hypothetical protein
MAAQALGHMLDAGAHVAALGGACRAQDPATGVPLDRLEQNRKAA